MMEKAGSSPRIISTIVLIGFALAVFYKYIASHYLGYGAPFDTFLFYPSDKFRDFLNMYEITKNLNPYNSGFSFNSLYYPFANVFIFTFSLIPIQTLSLLVFEALFFCAYIIAIWKTLSKIPTIGLIDFICIAFLPYPFLFAIDRANLEIYLVLLIWAFLYLYLVKGNMTLSCVLLAVAISMKLYPAVFLVILLKDKRFKELFFVLLYVALLSFVSLALFQGGFRYNIKSALMITNVFNSTYSGVEGIHWGVSFYGALKLTLFALYKIINGRGVSSDLFHMIDKIAFPIYLSVCLVVFTLISYLIVTVKSKPWQVVTILLIMMVGFPNVSFDYKLLYFIIPTIMLIEASEEKALLSAILLALLLVPKDYIFIYNDISVAVLINPAIMLLLGLLIIPEWWEVSALKRFSR
jgi:hypothetical protein